MDDIRKIARHALFYTIVTARSFGLAVSHVLLLLFFPITWVLIKLNGWLANGSWRPCRPARGR